MNKDYKSYNKVIAYILVAFAFLFVGKGSDMNDIYYDFSQSRGGAVSYIKAQANKDVITDNNANKTDKIVVGINERMVNTFDDNHWLLDAHGSVNLQNSNRRRFTANIIYDNSRVLHPPLSKLQTFRI